MDDAGSSPVRGSMKTVYYFGAESCPSCKRLKPHIKKMQPRYGIYLLDVDDDGMGQALSEQFEVKSIPTVVVQYPDGRYDRLVNPTPVTVQALLESE